MNERALGRTETAAWQTLFDDRRICLSGKYRMSSDSVYSSARGTPRTPSPPPFASEHRRPHSSKKKKKQQTRAESSCSKEQQGPDAPLSLKGQAFQLLAMALVAWLVATWGFKSIEWVQEQLKPFCDSDVSNEAEISGECMPCPENGSCQNGNLECFVGFKRVGKSCVKDKEIDQNAEKLAGYLRNYVCGLAARAVCDGASGAVWVWFHSGLLKIFCTGIILTFGSLNIWQLRPELLYRILLTDDEAQAQLKEEGLQDQLGLDDKSWLLVWEKMARIVEDSITTQSDVEGKQEFGCPSELVQRYKPVKCQIREWVVANLATFIITSPLVLLVVSFISKCLKRRKTNARAEEVYLQVCEALEEKALESREMAGGESWVVVSRLRDHVLFPSERKRAALWRQVEGFVQEDSRIDQYQKKVKGEMKIVWEWQVEGALRTPGVRNKVRQKAHISHASPQQLPQEHITPVQIVQ